MNRRQLGTLEKLFEVPTRSDIEWTEVDSLLRALEAHLEEGSGSRIRIWLNGRRAVIHRPHPRKEINKSTVESIRRFLELVKETPEKYR